MKNLERYALGTLAAGSILMGCENFKNFGDKETAMTLTPSLTFIPTPSINPRHTVSTRIAMTLEVYGTVSACLQSNSLDCKTPTPRPTSTNIRLNTPTPYITTPEPVLVTPARVVIPNTFSFITPLPSPIRIDIPDPDYIPNSSGPLAAVPTYEPPPCEDGTPTQQTRCLLGLD